MRGVVVATVMEGLLLLLQHGGISGAAFFKPG
jgi:hypothetical protein